MARCAMDDFATTINPPENANSWWGHLLSALPDTLTAGGCMIVWLAPRAFGDNAVKAVLLMMLMEFILVHATGFFTAFAMADGSSRTARITKMLGLSLFYLLFVGMFGWIFHSWWPLTAFAWLVVGKVAWVFANPRTRADETGRQMTAWAFSVLAYLGSVFAGLVLPVPQLGLDVTTVATLHLPASGEWIDHPHTAVASAVIYYSALALFKGVGWRMPKMTYEGA